MKTSILLPLGGLLLLLCPGLYGQNSTTDMDSDIQTKIRFNPGNTVQHYLATDEILIFEQAGASGASGQSTASETNASSSSYSGMRATGVSGYSTALGLRGGYTSGISFKHFVKSNAALELVLGTRWEGFSLTALYEWHSPNALGVSQLSWVYGLGGRIGNYRGDRFYGSGRGNCNNPNDRNCGNYWGNRSLTAVGLAGIGGLEFKFDEIPITISLDLIPVLYLNHWGGTFFDGSVSVRYVIK